MVRMEQARLSGSQESLTWFVWNKLGVVWFSGVTDMVRMEQARCCLVLGSH
jgi:hypothetical protein